MYVNPKSDCSHLVEDKLITIDDFKLIDCKLTSILI